MSLSPRVSDRPSLSDTTVGHLTPLGKAIVARCEALGFSLRRAGRRPLNQSILPGLLTKSVTSRGSLPKATAMAKVAAFLEMTISQVLALLPGATEVISRNPLARWAYIGRLEKGLSQADLARRVNASRSMIGFIECGRHLPRRPLLRRLTRELGPLPWPVWSFFRKTVSGWFEESVRRRERRTRDKVSKWNRQRLAREIKDLGEDSRRYLKDVPYVGVVGEAGYRAYMKAKMEKLNRANPERRGGYPVGQIAGRPFRSQLATTLRDLQAERITLFQCQACRDIVGRATSLKWKGKVCWPCRMEYLKQSGFTRWMRWDRSDSPPPYSRRPGPIIDSEELRRRIIALLKWVLQIRDEEDVDAVKPILFPEEYARNYDTYRLLERSKDRWALKIVNNCRELERPRLKSA